MAAIDFTNPTMKVFYMCAALLGIKTLLMALLTARMRFKKRVVATPEDKVLMMKNSKILYNDPDVERVRRAHRNDLENILIFFNLGCFYGMTAPNPVVATLLYAIYTLSRYAYTYVYAIKVTPQPARFLCFAVGYVINLYMAGSIMYHTGIM